MGLLDFFRSSDENETCEFAKHDYGKWEEFQWLNRFEETEDSLVLKLGFEAHRYCQNCNYRDTYWCPEREMVDVDVEWRDGNWRGSDANRCIPIFKSKIYDATEIELDEDIIREAEMIVEEMEDGDNT